MQRRKAAILSKSEAARAEEAALTHELEAGARERACSVRRQAQAKEMQRWRESAKPKFQKLKRELDETQEQIAATRAELEAGSSIMRDSGPARRSGLEGAARPGECGQGRAQEAAQREATGQVAGQGDGRCLHASPPGHGGFGFGSGAARVVDPITVVVVVVIVILNQRQAAEDVCAEGESKCENGPKEGRGEAGSARDMRRRGTPQKRGLGMDVAATWLSGRQQELRRSHVILSDESRAGAMGKRGHRADGAQG